MSIGAETVGPLAGIIMGVALVAMLALFIRSHRTRKPTPRPRRGHGEGTPPDDGGDDGEETLYL